MHSDILNNYLNKDVEVKIKTGDTYKGNIKFFDESKEIVVLSPSQYRSEKSYRSYDYGDTVLRQSDIMVVRELVPVIEEQEENEDKQMVGQPPFPTAQYYQTSSDEAEDFSSNYAKKELISEMKKQLEVLKNYKV